jgi:N utilization substance protein A
VLKTVITSEEEKTCTVVVPNNQLSLAIGNKGQNAKLAAKLTGYKIDIKPQFDTLTGEEAPEMSPDFKVPEPVVTAPADEEEELELVEDAVVLDEEPAAEEAQTEE